MNTLKCDTVAIGLLLIGVLGACSTSPPTHLYLIEPMTTSGSAATGTQLTVIVGPIELPEYLNRKEILTRDAPYRIHAAEFDRWAEPLDDTITAVLVENLSILIPTDRAIAYPSVSTHDADYTVRARITTFGTEPGGGVVLGASWTIHDATGATVKLRKTRYLEPRQGDDTLAVVAAMSRAVGQFSRDIALALTAASQARSQ